MNEVPVLLIVFNRSDLTKVVIEAIRKMQPPVLFIAADGPRKGVESDLKDCAQVREKLEVIDWPCEVVRLYRDENIGCDQNVPSAITRVLQDFDKIIVIEDDCVPDPSFLPFCNELLERFHRDTRISMICGSLPVDFPDPKKSYFFSRYYSSWGWATWRRAWQEFDYDMRTWPTERDAGFLRTRFTTDYEYRRWCMKYQSVYDSEKGPWDAKWGYACRRAGGLAVFSHVSLISNQGIGHDMATHSKNKNLRSVLARRNAKIVFPLQHPLHILPDVTKERLIKAAVANTQRPLTRLKGRLKAIPALMTDVGQLIREYYETL